MKPVIGSAFGRLERKKRAVRSKIRKNSRFRLSVHKSIRHFYVQLIDDVEGVTLASASTLDPSVRSVFRGTLNIMAVKSVAALMAVRLRVIAFDSKFAFDRGSYRYTGMVAVFADELRSAGFIF